MNIPIVKVPSGTCVAVIGDIHEHRKQFLEIVKRVQPSEKMFLVSVGDVYDKGYGTDVAEAIIDDIKTMHASGFGFIVRGNHELKHIRKGKNRRSNMSKQLAWMAKQPLTISFEFSTGTRVSVLHGGVKPAHTWQDLGTDVEVAYVRNLDESGQMIKLKLVEENGQKVFVPEKPNGVSWHKSYDGRFGYIAAGHEPQKDGVAKFYNYSCNLDSACYVTGIMSCQIFDAGGRREFFTVSGPAKNSSDDDD